MKNALFLAFAFALFVGFSSCTKEDDLCVEDRIADCLCTHVYEPVCGCNDVTYGNACAAACAGISDVTPGECR